MAPDEGTRDRELARCDAEIMRCLARIMDDPDWELALLGFYDWHQERRLILAETE